MDDRSAVVSVEGGGVNHVDPAEHDERLGGDGVARDVGSGRSENDNASVSGVEDLQSVREKSNSVLKADGGGRARKKTTCHVGLTSLFWTFEFLHESEIPSAMFPTS